MNNYVCVCPAVDRHHISIVRPSFGDLKYMLSHFLYQQTCNVDVEIAQLERFIEQLMTLTVLKHRIHACDLKTKKGSFKGFL